jgi:hypothetical protein
MWLILLVYPLNSFGKQFSNAALRLFYQGKYQAGWIKNLDRLSVKTPEKRESSTPRLEE